MTGKKSAHVSEEKKKIVRELSDLIKNKRTILIASIKNIPGSQFQEIVKKLRGKAIVKVPKKNLIFRAIDDSGKEAEKRAVIIEGVKNMFERYGIETTETTVIENESFVKGENEKDEAVSDIYKLQDKGKRKLALRYEFTFQLKRLMKNKKLPYKRFQIGPVFRD